MLRFARLRKLASFLVPALVLGCGQKDPKPQTAEGTKDPATVPVVAPVNPRPNPGSHPKAPSAPSTPPEAPKGQLPARDSASEVAAAEALAARQKQSASADAKVAEAIRARTQDKPQTKAIIGNDRFARRGVVASLLYLSPDGTRVAIGELDLKNPELKWYRIQDLESGKEICRFDATGGSVLSAAFSPDGATLALAGHDKRLTLWDTRTGQRKAEFPLRNMVWSIEYTPDGNGLLMSISGALVIVDPVTGKIRREYGEQDRSVPAMSPSGAVIAAKVRSWRGDYSIGLWETASGRPISTLKLDSSVSDLRFSQDGGTLYFCRGNSLVAWDLASDKAKDVFTTTYMGWFALSPDLKWAGYVNSDLKLVLRDLASGTEIFTSEYEGIGKILFFPGGTLLGTFSNSNLILWDLPAMTGSPK